MAVGKEIETRGHIVGFKEEVAKTANLSDDEFFTWFNSSSSKDAAFVRGNWDFAIHIAQHMAHYVSTPEEKAVLEIGHGGGRILAAASGYFSKAVGIDVHENNGKVEAELHSRGIHNFKLLKTDGRQIPVESASIDVVYSFIVLQHVEKIDIFENYVREAYRVLKPGGVAVLYFGRKYTFSHNKTSKRLYQLDKLLERLRMPKGFQEFPAKVNSTNLKVSLPYAKSLAKRIGYDVLCNLVSRKAVPDGVARYGGQNGLLLRKPLDAK